jgi:glutathione S-transferase
MLKILIANKNYSSWSMRPWLVLKHFAIPFEEEQISLNAKDWAEQVGRYSPALRVPVLIDQDFAVWDTLAIIEYLAEKFSEHEIWPGAPRARARARCLAAEMHAGFSALRAHWPMNISASLPGHVADAAVTRDLARLTSMWESALDASGGPFLFGPFSAADAMYAPVVSRFKTYQVGLSDIAQAYCERVLANHAVIAWTQGAMQETEFVEDDEPYRTAPARP